jgi:hypothetical protein
VRRDVRCWSLGRLAVDDTVRSWDLSGRWYSVDPAVATFACGIFVDVFGLAVLNGLVVTSVERSRRSSRQQSRSS